MHHHSEVEVRLKRLDWQLTVEVLLVLQDANEKNVWRPATKRSPVLERERKKEATKTDSSRKLAHKSPAF